jgi:hypothetical protein
VDEERFAILRENANVVVDRGLPIERERVQLPDSRDVFLRWDALLVVLKLSAA